MLRLVRVRICLCCDLTDKTLVYKYEQRGIPVAAWKEISQEQTLPKGSCAGPLTFAVHSLQFRTATGISQISMKFQQVALLSTVPLLFLANCLFASKPSNVNLKTFVGCAVREFTFLAKKPGCQAMRITTDACWGRCETWEKPVLDPPYIEAHHRVCTYNETKQVTVILLHCAANVNPFYTYPKAIRCSCGVCLTATTECETV